MKTDLRAVLAFIWQRKEWFLIGGLFIAYFIIWQYVANINYIINPYPEPNGVCRVYYGKGKNKTSQQTPCYKPR